MEPKFKRVDVQASTSGFKNIDIKKVGVRNIKLPLEVVSKDDNSVKIVNGTLSGYVELSADNKGINMSRFSRTLMEVCENKPLRLREFVSIAEKLRRAHNSNNLYLKAEFEYYTITFAPWTRLPAVEPIPVVIETHLKGEEIKTYITVQGTQISCCPCSKNMSLLVNNISDEQELELKNLSEDLYNKVINSGFGAHNQRSIITIKVLAKDNQNLPWIEDIYNFTVDSASAESCNTLKREDEKYVTEHAYDNPKFVDNSTVDEDLSDITGLVSGKTSENSEEAPAFAAPDLSDLLNPIAVTDDSQGDMPDLSMFEEQAPEEEIVEEEPEEVSIADMGLDALLAGAGFDNPEPEEEVIYYKDNEWEDDE